MDITIHIDFGNGYVVSLTPQDARILRDKLNDFCALPGLMSFTTLGGNGYEAPSVTIDSHFQAENHGS